MSKNARKLRISELIKRELSQILNSFTFNKDFDCSFYITVTEVDISNDLKNATVFILPTSQSETKLKNRQVLDSIILQSNLVRKRLGALNLRFTPKLKFKIDDLTEKRSKIDELFNSPKVAQDLS